MNKLKQSTIFLSTVCATLPLWKEADSAFLMNLLYVFIVAFGTVGFIRRMQRLKIS